MYFTWASTSSLLRTPLCSSSSSMARMRAAHGLLSCRVSSCAWSCPFSLKLATPLRRVPQAPASARRCLCTGRPPAGRRSPPRGRPAGSRPCRAASPENRRRRRQGAPGSGTRRGPPRSSRAFPSCSPGYERAPPSPHPAPARRRRGRTSRPRPGGSRPSPAPLELGGPLAYLFFGEEALLHHEQFRRRGPPLVVAHLPVPLKALDGPAHLVGGLVAFCVQHDVHRVGEALPVLDLVVAAVYRAEFLAPAAHVVNLFHGLPILLGSVSRTRIRRRTQTRYDPLPRVAVGAPRLPVHDCLPRRVGGGRKGSAPGGSVSGDDTRILPLSPWTHEQTPKASAAARSLISEAPEQGEHRRHDALARH